jgi:NAD(P)-dependent dehydrogenase (short-subunit alcohol dehydrogenase family)
MTPPLAGKIALVTGASRGIGYAAALALARAGAHVVALARTVGGLEELDDAIRTVGGSATLVPLDLKDSDGIARLGAALNERYQRLDILIGNAGVLGPLSPLGHVEPKAWDEVIAVNVTANWQLIRCMDPLLRQSEAGRVVFITSGLGASPRAYWGPYAVSKAALDALAYTYAAETASTNVRVNLFSPGPTRTRMRAIAMPGEDPMSLKTAEVVGDKIVALCLPAFQMTGKVYDFRQSRLLMPRPPAPDSESISNPGNPAARRPG